MSWVALGTFVVVIQTVTSGPILQYVVLPSLAAKQQTGNRSAQQAAFKKLDIKTLQTAQHTSTPQQDIVNPKRHMGTLNKDRDVRGISMSIPMAFPTCALHLADVGLSKSRWSMKLTCPSASTTSCVVVGHCRWLPSDLGNVMYSTLDGSAKVVPSLRWDISFLACFYLLGAYRW